MVDEVNPKAKRKGLVRASLGNQNVQNTTTRVKQAVGAAAGKLKSGAQAVGARLSDFRNRSRGGGAQTRTGGGGAQTRTGGGGRGGRGGGARLSPGSTGKVPPNQQLVPTRNQLSTRVTPGAARAGGARGLLSRFGLPVAGASIGINAATSSQEELEQASGLPEVTPLRGEQPAGQAPGSQAPVNLEGPFDPILAAARPAVGLLRQSFGFGAEEPTQETPQTGLREFTNASVIGDPANRGTDSVAQNQQVAANLDRRGQAERAGLRAGQRGTDTAGRLARSGGIASAFGSLALSGNQLRRGAADRSRAFSSREASAKRREDANLSLRNKITEIGARSEADKIANFDADAQVFAKSRQDAIASGDQRQIDIANTTIIDSAINDPNGAAVGQAQQILASTLIEESGGIFNSIFGNDFSDADIVAAVDKVSLDEVSGELLLPNPDGSGTPVEIGVEIDSLPAQQQRLIGALINRRIGTENLGRGDPNRGNPNRPTLRSGRRGT